MKRNRLVVIAIVLLVILVAWCYASRRPLAPEAPAQPPAAEGRPPAPN